MKRSVIFLFFILLFIISCSKKTQDTGLLYTNDEFDKLSHEALSLKPMGPDAIPFSDYSLGVNKDESRTLEFERLKFFAVKFTNEKLAHDEALRLNQYYSRNFLFDRVEGEPVLEDYVIKAFNAKNPNRAVQRTPKKEEHGHGEHAEHGTEHGEHPAPAAHH